MELQLCSVLALLLIIVQVSLGFLYLNLHAPPPTPEYPLLPSSQRLMTAAPGGGGVEGLGIGEGGSIQSVLIVK